MKDQIRIQVASILSQILETHIAPEDNPTRKDLSKWDSLKHFELVLLLEEEFNIRFSAEQVANMDSLDDLVNRIGEKQ